MDDGPNPHPPQWSDRHCRQCSCSWKGWHGTWTNVSTNSCKSPMNMDLSSKRDKYAVKQTSVVFFRCVYDATGAHPDPEKVSGVHKMPAPKTATKLQKFLGLVTYLLPFIPSCFSFTTPYMGCWRKGTEFICNTSFQEAFNTVISLLCKDTTLWYFNICKPVTIQVDTSQKGLGAALLQDGHPVTFASKAFLPV